MCREHYIKRLSQRRIAPAAIQAAELSYAFVILDVLYVCVLVQGGLFHFAERTTVTRTAILQTYVKFDSRYWAEMTGCTKLVTSGAMKSYWKS